ncbi:MAG: hypothetical protein FWH07_00795 [Oscillospiraceae bacterium]|nr:hypothetical protein [Oscillospiraceae bacterium]
MQFKHTAVVKRVTALTLSLCVALVFLLSDNVGFSLINHEHEHSCIEDYGDYQESNKENKGEQEEECDDIAKCCKVCLHINGLKKFNSKAAVLGVASANCKVAITAAISKSAFPKTVFATPVSLKTQLNN